MSKVKIVLAGFILLLIVLCYSVISYDKITESDIKEIKSYEWLFTSGYHSPLGDVIVQPLFKYNSATKEYHIYIDSKPIAKIIRYDRCFIELEIEYLSNGKRAIYGDMNYIFSEKDIWEYLQCRVGLGP